MESFTPKIRGGGQVLAMVREGRGGGTSSFEVVRGTLEVFSHDEGGHKEIPPL